VPQGSVLSVTLFAVTISGMINAVGPSVTSLYVDVAIYCSSRSMVKIEGRLRLAINRLSHWALRNGFTSSQHPPSGLYLHNRALSFPPAVKLLGLIDSKLTWEPHLRCFRLKCERSPSILKILSAGLRAETSRRCYDFTLQ
jgi:hypothetical protein